MTVFRSRFWLLSALWLSAAGAENAPATVAHASSPTELVNAHLPSWVRLTGEARFREEGFLGNRFVPGSDDMYLLQRFRPATYWAVLAKRIGKARNS